MDVKTLAYMGERVDKARELKMKIQTANVTHGLISELKEIRFLEIEGPCSGKSYSFDLSKSIPREYWNTEVKETLLLAITNYRDSLQHKLDEL